MDPYDRPLKGLGFRGLGFRVYSSPNSPFPHSLLRTRQTKSRSFSQTASSLGRDCLGHLSRVQGRTGVEA